MPLCAGNYIDGRVVAVPCFPHQVRWLESGDGLEFRRHGSAATSGTIKGSGARTNASGTIEIWLVPTRSEGSSTILSFDGSAHPGEPFSLHQRGDALAIRQNNVDPQGVSRTDLFYVERVFQQNKAVMLAVTLGEEQTDVYINGTLAERFHIRGAWNDLTGRVVLANSPVINDSWTGKILGLAIYQRERTAPQIAADYASWVAKKRPVARTKRDASALYLFDEHGGTVAHNTLIFRNRPYHSKALFHPAPTVFARALEGISPDTGLLAGCRREYCRVRPFWLLCFCLPFVDAGDRAPRNNHGHSRVVHESSIELLQVFLPTRSSDVTDLITNTLGCVIGVIICRSAIGQLWSTKARATLAGTKPHRARVGNA